MIAIIAYITFLGSHAAIDQQSIDVCRSALSQPSPKITAKRTNRDKTLSRCMAAIITDNISLQNQPALYNFTQHFLTMLKLTNRSNIDFKRQVIGRLRTKSIEDRTTQREHDKYLKLYSLFCSPVTIALTKKLHAKGLTILNTYYEQSHRAPNRNIYFGAPVAPCKNILHADDLKLGMNFYVRFFDACEN